MFQFSYKGRVYNIETVSFQQQVTSYRAYAVCGEERVEIPGAVSGTESGAEMQGLLSVAMIPDVSVSGQSR